MSRTAMRARGFTLIELLITVAIIATLASIAAPLYQVSVQRSREHDLRRALRQIRDSIDAYKQASDEGHIVRSVDQSGYPPTLAVLVDGVRDAKSPTGAMIYFLRKIPRDPFATDSSLTAAQTWSLRSYQSPPDQPAPGSDVFDVHSRSKHLGLNGVPYNEW